MSRYQEGILESMRRFCSEKIPPLKLAVKTKRDFSANFSRRACEEEDSIYIEKEITLDSRPNMSSGDPTCHLEDDKDAFNSDSKIEGRFAEIGVSGYLSSLGKN